MTNSFEGETPDTPLWFRRANRKPDVNSQFITDSDSDTRTGQRNDLWHALPIAQPSETVLQRERIVAGKSAHVAAAPIAMLRTQILQAMAAHRFDSFAVASPTPDCGSSFVAMNLAFSMARQKNINVLLLDLCLGQPSLARRLDVPDQIAAFRTFGVDIDMPEKVVRLGANLALGYVVEPVADTSERLQNRSDGGIIERLRHVLNPDVIICDMPPVLRSDDLVALAPQLGGVLIVADGAQTVQRDIVATEALLKDRTRFIGLVLNRGTEG